VRSDTRRRREPRDQASVCGTLIEKLTDALAETSGAAKEHIQVIVQGVSPKHWGVAGKPGS
jgi:4-oxalocrotonate tautomerase family enzyme